MEQEVEGDDTPVIDAVLASDVKRVQLLAEERELQAKINRFVTLLFKMGSWDRTPHGHYIFNDKFFSPDTPDDQRTALSARLDAVYAEQQNLQLDKAPARAATILFGLGFKPDEQRKPTK